MAKKEKFHSTASEAVTDLLEEVIEKYHDGLTETQFLILFKHGGWKSKGKTVFGKAKVLSDDFRSTWGKDVILYLNADMWALLSPPQKKYVLDHQMYTLDLKYDRHDNPKEAADGRPLLTTVPPDIEGFVDVVKRHGIIMEDVKRLAKAMTEATQITLEEVLQFENNENAADDFRNKVHEGLSGTIAPDGTVTVEDELDMDQVLAEAEQEDKGTEEPSGVADLGKERAKRVTKVEKEAAALAKAAEEERLLAEAEATASVETQEDDDDLLLE